MNCPDCGTKLKINRSYAIPRGQVRKLKCPGCFKDFYTTELIQENDNFFRAVYNRYQNAWEKERKMARIEARAKKVKERRTDEQRTPEKLPSN